MTTGELLKDILAGIAAGGAWAIRASDACPLPYIVYSASTNTNNSLDGPSDLQPARVQIDCYASTYIGVKALEDAVVAVLGNRPNLIGSPVAFSSLQENQFDLFDDDRRAYRSLLEFSLWRA